MTAVITDQYKKLLSDTVIKQIDSGDRYYIAVGRAEEWENNTVPSSTPTQIDYQQSPESQRITRLSLQSAKRVFNYSYVIPRYNWNSGTIYQGYDNAISDVTDNNKYYVITDQNTVYMCLRSAFDGSGNIVASTVQPTGTSTAPFQTSDGYLWKFMYTISVGDTDKYVTTKFIPVKFVDSAGSGDPATDVEQKAIQDAASPKQIVGYEVTNNGGGSYSANPTVTIVGNGSGATARAVIDGSGNLISVQVDSNGSGDLQFGTGYDYAEAIVTGAGEARPILSPAEGIGGNPLKELRATRVMFNARFIDDEDGTILASGQDFRQVCLLRNPTQYNDSAAFTANSGIFLEELKLSTLSGTANIQQDDIITGTGSPAPKGVVDRFVDSGGVGLLLFHQNDSTGYTPFTASMTITNGSGFSGQTFGSNFINEPDIDKFNGELLYIDNRAAVPRDDTSQQDLKLIIRF